MAMKFTEQNFDSEVLQSDQLVMVDFYADWCGPCKMMAPVVDELAEQFDGAVKIGKVNVDENQGLSERYKVMTIPMIIFFKNGEVMDVVNRVVPKSILEGKLNQYK